MLLQILEHNTLCINIQDVPGENISEVFEEASDWINTALEVIKYQKMDE